MDFSILQKDFLVFRMFRISARCSKHDVWNLGEFGIGIGDPIFFGRTIFRRKKSENFLVEKKLGQEIFDF